MFCGHRIAIVIPAYNERALIRRTVSGLPRFVDMAVVVDDGSSDGTLQALAEGSSNDVPVICIRHEENRGVGAAIVTGYRRALEQGAEIVVVMGGDAQMDPQDLPRLLGPIVDGAADYVQGDRMSWPEVRSLMPPARFVGVTVLTWLTRMATGYMALSDSQCGYTAIAARTLRGIDLDAVYPRYGFPNDFLAHLATVGARLAQVPVRPIYADETSGLTFVTGAFVVPWVVLRSFAGRISRVRSSRLQPRLRG